MSVHTQPAAAHGHAPHVTVKTLLVIYGMLIGLMFLTLGAALIDLGRANFMIAMGIAAVKMFLIVVYFMHVRYSPKLIWVASFGAFLWLLILVGGFMNDYLTRDLLLNLPGK